MRDSGWLRLLFVLALVALVAVGVGIPAYNAGVAQGLAESGKIVAPPVAGAPYVYGWHGYYGPFGFGFGLLGCLVPLLFFFLFFGLVRGIVWRGGWGRHGWHHGGWEGGVPPMFAEWHKRAHGEPPAEPQGKASA